METLTDLEGVVLRLARHKPLMKSDRVPAMRPVTQ